MKNPFSPTTNVSQNIFLRRQSKSNGDLIDFYEDVKDSDNSEYDEFLGKSIETNNLKWLLMIVFLGLIILVFRVYYLQVQKGDYYSSLAAGNRIRKFVVPAARGIVFDKNGDLLVRNVPRFSVFITVADLPINHAERELVFEKLIELIEIEREEIINIINKQKELKNFYQPISIKNNLSYDEALGLQIAIKELAGINLEVSEQREYLGGENFSPILGYVGQINEKEYAQKRGQGYLLNDIIGKIGIEYIYEDELKGQNGFEEVEVNALGKRKKILNIDEPVAGNNLYLTIDKEFQDQTEIIVQKVLQEKEKSKASVIIMDPRTGEILVLLSLPTYDNNLFARGIEVEEYQELLADPDKPMFFRAVSGEYPSGSTVKIVWSAAALQEDIITPRTTILSTGGIQIGQWQFPDWREGGHGLTNVKKAIADSVNTFYYYIGGGYKNFKGMGIEKMGKYAGLFNIGQKTGIDLTGERSGFFPTKQWKMDYKGEIWYIGDTYHVSIGQGNMLATPLQVAVWTSFFANEGKIIKPHLVNKIEYENDSIEINPEIIREGFIDSEYIEVVKQGMRQGVTDGSSRFLSDLPVKVGGKTGTAQWSSIKDNHAWWTGFLPYDDPKLVITILVEEGEESKTAVVVAKEIIKWWLERESVE